MRRQPLGDSAVLVYCDSEDLALRFAQAVRRSGPKWLVDVVQAYTAVAVYFDLATIHMQAVSAFLDTLDWSAEAESNCHRHRIPVCYEMGLDLQRIAEHTGLTADAIIDLHASRSYTVYAIGFCPGFPYLGYLPEKLTGVPRLPSPRLRVDAGSVGLTGRQTGIYTEPRPGGWNIVGRTPLELVNVADGYFPLRTGDEVEFYRIDEFQYKKLAGDRLSTPWHETPSTRDLP